MARTLRNAVSAAMICCALAANMAVAAGINLSWNDCGSAGTDCLTFACDANTGPEFAFVGSFVPPPGVTAPQYMEAHVRIISDAAPGSLPDWWRVGSLTECRGFSLQADTLFGTTCANVLRGAVFLPAFSYSANSPVMGEASMVVSVLFPELAPPLDPGVEHYAFMMHFDRAKTTGPGACAGCDVGVQIVLNHIDIFQDPAVQVEPVVVDQYMKSNKIGWNNPAYCFWTPTKRSSWGQVRSLYR